MCYLYWPTFMFYVNVRQETPVPNLFIQVIETDALLQYNSTTFSFSVLPKAVQ